MAFLDSTSAQRVELLRQADKTANLTRRVTIGSGNLGAPEGELGEELCTALAAALSDVGYSGIPPGTVIVDEGAPAAILPASGTGAALTSGQIKVTGGQFAGVTMTATQAVVRNATNYTVMESNGTSVVSSSCPATVSGNAFQRLTLPATIGAAAGGATVPGGVVNSAGGDTHPATFTVAGGKFTNVKITAATTAMVDDGEATIATQNSAGTVVGAAGIAVVAAGVMTAFKLPATTAPTTSTTTPAIQNSTGAISGGNGTVTVTNGAIANIKLPATHAIVTAGPATPLPVTGTYVTSVAFTVAGGVITGIVLS